MPEKQSIPILGMDTRPLARQASPGLCKEIINLRPDGPKGDPHWVPVAYPSTLKNNTGVAFDHPKKNSIVDSFFFMAHQTADGDQQKRLVLIFSDGSLDVVNPNGAGGWNIITSYFFGDADTEWHVDFAPVAKILAIAISKGDKPYKILYLYDDKIIYSGFPRLPAVNMSPITVNYSDAEVETDTHSGLRNGWYGWRYGFNIGSHSVALSPPTPFEVDNGINPNNGIYTFSELFFQLNGYDSKESILGFDYWEKALSGIDVYLTERFESKRDVLLNGIYFNIFSFSGIDSKPAVGDETPNNYRYEVKTQDISTNRVSEINSPHRLAATVLHSYNNRLILGDVSVDFLDPGEGLFLYSEVLDNITISPISVSFETKQGPGNEYYDVTYELFLFAGSGSFLKDEGLTISYAFKDDVAPIFVSGPTKFFEEDGSSVRVTIAFNITDNYDYSVRLDSIYVNCTSYSNNDEEITDTFEETYTELLQPEIPQ